MHKSPILKNWPEIFCLVFAVVMLVLAIIGTSNHFSPVPLWDMWNGTLGFILNIQDGNYNSWWEQHNEHRIVLSKGLFFLDYTYFGGKSYLLIALNIAIASLSALLFWLFANALKEEKTEAQRPLTIASLIIFGFIYSWVQNENFAWGFQSQFFLAQILPLFSLYFIARAATERGNVNFWVAIFFGIISAGTMANGILALPVIFVFTLIIWQGIYRALITLSLAVFVPLTYFSDYTPVSQHGSLGESLRDDPLGLVQYTAMYLGSPFFHLLSGWDGARTLAVIAGLLSFLFCLIIAVRQMLQKQRSPYIVALLCFILYIGGTAFGTAGGRLSLGITGATASRYSTPAIMMWAAFTLAMISSFSPPSYYIRKALWGGTILICTLGLAYQVKSLSPPTEKIFSREMAALALELQIRDETTIGHVFPIADYALAIAKRAKERGLSIFGAYPYKNASESLGQTVKPQNAAACIGFVDEEKSIAGVTDFSHVVGWIFDPSSRRSPKLITFTDDEGVVIGVGLTGKSRPDVQQAVGAEALQSGFSGYIANDPHRDMFFAVGDNPLCRLELRLRK